MTNSRGLGGVEVIAAIAAISAQPIDQVAADLLASNAEGSDNRPADPDEVERVVDMISTRLGLAPSVGLAEARALRARLAALVADESTTVNQGEVRAWAKLLRHTSEYVRTLTRNPVMLPPLPQAQVEMWHTLLALEDAQSQPWVLVGGQMTMLHCLENDVTSIRPTNDGDVVVGVWTRRDALLNTSRFLRAQDFHEVKTSDGYGYRYERGDTAIDLLLPEGLERQRSYPRTATGRRGFATDGGNQAIARAERLPINVGGVTGHVRRPNLLGSIVAKAHAFVIDSKDPERHAQDLVILAGIALRNPRVNLQDAVASDRKPVARALRSLPAGHRVYRLADDPEGAHAFLMRLALPTASQPERLKA